MIKALGLETIALDVTNPKSIKAAAAEVEKKAGRIGTLFLFLEWIFCFLQ